MSDDPPPIVSSNGSLVQHRDVSTDFGGAGRWLFVVSRNVKDPSNQKLLSEPAAGSFTPVRTATAQRRRAIPSGFRPTAAGATGRSAALALAILSTVNIASYFKSPVAPSTEIGP